MYTGMTVQMSVFVTAAVKLGHRLRREGESVRSRQLHWVDVVAPCLLHIRVLGRVNSRVTRLEDFSTIAFFIVANGLMGVVLILRMKLSGFNEGSVNKL